ncbi:MAG: hypothetical protein ABFS86_15270, partial [Planctomycetota bacterium]
MTILPKILIALVLVGLAFLFTHRALPWLTVRIGRALGFRMEMNPLTQRRVQKFRTISRGYWSFVFITTGFVLSLFLEITVNRLPLYISYENDEGQVTRQFPAFADWADTLVPFVSVTSVARADRYGLRGDAEVPYRVYARWVHDPENLEADAAKIEAAIVEDENRFRDKMAEVSEQRGTTYDRQLPLPEFKVEEQQNRQDYAAFLRSLRPKFEAGRATVVMPLYPFNAAEQILDEYEGSPPHPGFRKGYPLLGTDFEGKDSLAQILYGFRLSFAFAIVVSLIGYTIGICVGAIMGYFG